MIKCKNISLSFNEQPIIRDLNFSIDPGTKACLYGVSGKGKTSVFKLLQGYFFPDSGKIEINGMELTPQTIDTIRRSIAWIPQNVNLPVNNGIELMEMLNIKNRREMVTNFWIN